MLLISLKSARMPQHSYGYVVGSTLSKHEAYLSSLLDS